MTTDEEIENYRKLVQEADQRRRGIDISYTRRGANGERISVSLHGATPEQVAIIHWLQAEDEWHANKKYRERQLKQELERQRRRQKEIDRQNKLIGEHVALMQSPGITGFRRDSLLRHAPMRLDNGDRLLCTSCYDTEYEPQHLGFPCEEYVFTRDWAPKAIPIIYDEFENGPSDNFIS